MRYTEHFRFRDAWLFIKMLNDNNEGSSLYQYDYLEILPENLKLRGSFLSYETVQFVVYDF